MRGICLLIATVACLLSGCSSYIQLASGYAGAATKSLQDAEDLNLRRLKFSLCATPYSAIMRNPEFIVVIKELCMKDPVPPIESLLDKDK